MLSAPTEMAILLKLPKDTFLRARECDFCLWKLLRKKVDIEETSLNLEIRYEVFCFLQNEVNIMCFDCVKS